MNVLTRGIRNAFRNQIRTFSIVVILGLSMALALAMLVAHNAVGQKINSIKGSVGNTVTISPAGVRGFVGGGNPLTESQISPISKLAHVTSIEESLNDRLTSTNSNLQSAISAGSLGQRFAGNSGETFTPSGGGGGFASVGGSGSSGTFSFTPPITVLGTTSPTDLNNTIGGGTFSLTSGTVFSSSSTADVALVGTSLASKNNLKVGSTFTAYSTTIKVTGIFNSGNTFSNNLVILPLATEQKISNQSGDITSAIVYVDSISNVNSVTSSIQKILGSAADVTNGSQEAQQTITPLQNIQSISLYSLLGAVIAGAVIIFLVMIMIVRERRREIGVIKAIGASNLKIMFQFMTEAVTLTVLGSIIGIALGVAAANPITRLLVNNTSTSSSSPTPGISISTTGSAGTTTTRTFGSGGGTRLFGGLRNNLSTIHGTVGWSIILYGLGVAVIIAIVGSTLASFFISKVRPAEVMRTE